MSILYGFVIARLLWKLNHGHIPIPFLSCPFEIGKSILKECIEAKLYQDWSKKSKKFLIDSNGEIGDIVSVLLYIVLGERLP